MSKGHCSPALYPMLALRGFFPVEDLKMFRRVDGHMSGHVEMHYVPGVDMSTGSLGQGISVAVGMALAGKQSEEGLPRLLHPGRRRDRRGPGLGGGDGRQQVPSGQPLRRASTSTACKSTAHTEEVMPTEPLDKKFESFGWHVIKIDGHDFEQIDQGV